MSSTTKAKNEENEEKFKKLKRRLKTQKVDLEHSRKMADRVRGDPDQVDDLEMWMSKISEVQEKIHSLNTEMSELEAFSRREDDTLQQAHEELRSLKVKIKKLRAKTSRARRSAKELLTPSRRPITLKPGCRLASLQQNMEGQGDSPLALDIYICPCVLCGHGFPAKDVVMASCGCNYHRWCVVTQNWLSRRCANQECDNVFTDEWRTTMGVFNKVYLPKHLILYMAISVLLVLLVWKVSTKGSHLPGVHSIGLLGVRFSSVQGS